MITSALVHQDFENESRTLSPKMNWGYTVSQEKKGDVATGWTVSEERWLRQGRLWSPATCMATQVLLGLNPCNQGRPLTGS